MPVNGTLGLGDLLVDPAQRAPRPVVAVLVVDDPIRKAAGLLAAGGWPGLGEHQPVGDRVIGVLVAPLAYYIGQERNLRAENVG